MSRSRCGSCYATSRFRDDIASYKCGEKAAEDVIARAAAADSDRASESGYRKSSSCDGDCKAAEPFVPLDGCCGVGSADEVDDAS